MLAMSWLELAIGVVAILLGNQGLSALLRTRAGRRKENAEAVKVEVETVKVSADALEIHGSAYSTLVATLSARMKDVEGEVSSLRADRAADRQTLSVLVEHVSNLEEHIRLDKGPPPPVRPTINYFPGSVQ